LKKNPLDYAKKWVEVEYTEKEQIGIFDSSEYHEKQWRDYQQNEYEALKNTSEGHKKYISSIMKVIEDSCEKKFYEINQILDFDQTLFNLKLDKDLKNYFFINTFLVNQTSLFLDLLTIGNFDSIDLPLRRYFEASLVAMYLDKKNRDINQLVKWTEGEYIHENNRKKNISGSNSIIEELCNPLVLRYNPNFKTKLMNHWKKLSTNVHKKKIQPFFNYEFKEVDFNNNVKLFQQITESLYILLILNFPEKFDSLKNIIDSRIREEIELLLLEN